MASAPILDNKDPDASSVFEPAALLREARRQKKLSPADIPPLCILDPAISFGVLEIPVRRSSRRSGLVITPISTKLRLPVNPPPSLAVPLERLSRSWWLKNFLLAAVVR
jgi:hypothetical protein